MYVDFPTHKIINYFHFILIFSVKSLTQKINDFEKYVTPTPLLDLLINLILSQIRLRLCINNTTYLREKKR